MQQVIDALKSGAAGSGPRPSQWEHAPREGPLGFKLSLHHKDLGIALQAAALLELDMPLQRWWSKWNPI